jgi:DNA adenine methylase
MDCKSSKHEVIALRKNPYGVTTPLRYPGGKSALTGHIADIINSLNARDDAGETEKITTYLEPYAGGAGAAISLLVNGIVEKIVINDRDAAIYSFWDSLSCRPQKLIELIEHTPVTMEEWVRQKDIYYKAKTKTADDRLTLGFATFFLNRTNRSGILTAGAIGGKFQNGNYALDVRYNKKVLIGKIEKIAQFRRNISVMCLDGKRVFQKHFERPEVFVYLDPPYVAQGKSLYLNAFTEKNHKDLAKIVSQQKSSNWLMTYDNEKLIREEYKDNFQYLFELQYSVQNKRKAHELIICSDTVNSVLCNH